MPITIREPGNFEDYSRLVDAFQTRMQELGHTAQQEMSNEREMGVAGVRRFVALNEHGTVVGWMTLKTRDADLKIEGICVAPKVSGAAKALVAAAVNCSLAVGKGGVLTLTNISNGTGDSFYRYIGFEDIGDNKMRLTIDWSKWDGRSTTPPRYREGKHKQIEIQELYRK